jgi:type IV pilus assembly protein PilX
VGIMMLLVLTLIAIGLTPNTRATMQLSAASVGREEAVQEALGGQEIYIDQQRQALGNSVFITNDAVMVTAPDPDDDYGIENTVTFIVETGCRRSRNATASSVIGCRQSELGSAVKFGKNDRGELSVSSGVEQPVLLSAGG